MRLLFSEDEITHKINNLMSLLIMIWDISQCHIAEIFIF